MKWLVLLLLPVLLALSGRAEEPGWVPVATEVIAREKLGYGGLSGVVVDRATGQLFIALSDQGVFRSGDQGKSWVRHGKEAVKGRTETPGCMQLDPTRRTNRLLFPTVYGGPIGLGSKESTDWRFVDPKVTHVDWCAFDWSGAEPGLMLTLKHESGGVLLASRDAGKSFQEVGPGYGPAWVFDGNTAVVGAEKVPDRPKGILRTTDGARTFQAVADYQPVALPHWKDGTLYWLVQGALIRSIDRGATWQKLSDLPNGQYGPVFGKRADDLYVLTRQGIIASHDDGRTWSKPLALPEWKGASMLTWIDYDPVNHLLYAMKMGSDLYRMPVPDGF